MTWSVRFRDHLENLPRPLRAKIDATLHELAESMSTIPAASPFWESLKHSQLQLDIDDWRVVYRADLAGSALLVVEVARLPSR